jgi:hypothetical protein
MTEGDFVLIVRGEPHVLRSGRRTKPIPLANLDRWPAHVSLLPGVVDPGRMIRFISFTAQRELT